MDKVKIKIFKLFLVTISFSNLSAIEFQRLAVVDFTENQNIFQTAGKGGVFFTRADGAFLYERAGNPYPWSIIVRSDKSHFTFIPSLYNSTYVTNFLSKTNINKINYDIVEVIENQNDLSVNSKIVFATVSNNGCLWIETRTFGTNTYVYQMTTATNEAQQNLINQQYNRGSELYLKKLNRNNEVVAQQKLDDLKTINSNLRDFDADSIFVSKFIVFCQITQTNLIFFRLVDPDFLSRQNRITLGSSQNGSLTATVNNLDLTTLNIQSSTNLIDWNTFKTIQNEPTLEIVVPANKPKEFIRAIE